MGTLGRMLSATVLGGVVCVLSGAASLSSSYAHEQTAPTAPSNAVVLAGTLSWQDNSSDEEGFRITVRLFGSTRGTPDLKRSYDVGSDVSSFVTPPEVLPSCDDRSAANWFVVAVRGALSSSPATYSIAGSCPPADEAATPDASRSLPSTGSDEVRLDRSPIPAGWLFAGGVSLIVLGILVRRYVSPVRIRSSRRRVR